MVRSAISTEEACAGEVKGAHFLHEESSDEVGEATARFVAKVLARQISRSAYA